MASVHLRTYGGETPKERHDFAQIVLPISGRLDIDVAGLQAELSRTTGAFIHHGVMHTQVGQSKNSSVIVDVAQHAISNKALDALHQHPFIDMNAHTLKLVDYISRSTEESAIDEQSAALWVPLLIDTLTNTQPSTASRLSALKAIVEIDPFIQWSVERMAEHMHISSSRLHVLFRDSFNETPHAWLARIRMDKVRKLLAQSSISVAEIAYRAGFSDQTALTRAMRNEMSMTPAAYRKAMANPQ